jgi:formamidopyrimidine-DNA glycosylase
MFNELDSVYIDWFNSFRNWNMPELPEVETSRRGIAPWVEHQQVREVIVRDRRLRWPIPHTIDRELPGQEIRSVSRRAKYLLFETAAGTAMLHLGMSGSVRIIDSDEPAGKHDHVDICLHSGKSLRFRDPRRFGSLLWSKTPAQHKLLRDLGPEPLGDNFDGAYLRGKARGRKVSIKQFIMNAAVVVGVGNIYASEALYLAQIHPKRSAGRISAERMMRLADAIRQVLQQAIDAGGTTLNDFVGGDGEPGYFRQKLNVYGRAGESCRRCDEDIAAVVLGQRSTFYCKRCQR